MDIKYYILLGGGVLIGVVLLHGFYLALKSRRQRNVAVAAGYGEAQQTDLDFEPSGPTAPAGSGAPSEAAAQKRLEPLLADVQANGVQDQSNESDDSESATEAPARGRRIIIPGKRTEPSVPRASRVLGMETQADHPSPSESQANANDVLVFWVVAKPEASFGGQELLDAFTSHGLLYDGNVFRRVIPDTNQESFMVANGVEPGTFDLSDIDALATPRIVLLLRLAPDSQLTEAFEDMLEVAQNVATTLGAELKDEHMSDMSGQTIEHCRQRIRDFRRLSFRT